MSQRSQILLAFAVAVLSVAFGLIVQAQREAAQLAKQREAIACEVRRDSVFLCDKLRHEAEALGAIPPP